MMPEQNPPAMRQRYVKSWTAYLKPSLLLALALLVSNELARRHGLLGAGAALLALGVFSLQVLTLHSVVLYTDAQGVWLYSGVLPWSRGYHGIHWRDVQCAEYYPHFLSWLFRSYSLRVGHRFTRTSEIKLTHMADGVQAVGHINAELQKVIGGRAG